MKWNPEIIHWDISHEPHEDPRFLSLTVHEEVDDLVSVVFCLGTMKFFFLRLDHFSLNFCILLLSWSAWNSCFRIFAWQSARICSLCFFRRILVCSLSELCLWIAWTLNLWFACGATSGSSRSIMTDWRRQTGRQVFFLRVIGSSSTRIKERLADGNVLAVEVIGGTAARPRTPGCIRHKLPWWSGCWTRNLWEGRARQGCQDPHWRKCTGNLSSTSWKNKLSGRRRTKWSERRWRRRKKWMEKSNQSEKLTTRRHMEHACENWMSAGLEPNAVWHRLNKDKQSRTLTTEENTQTTKRATMHDTFMRAWPT